MTACKIILLIVFCLGLCGIGFAAGWCFAYDKQHDESMTSALERFARHRRELEEARKFAYQVGRNAALSSMERRGFITEKQAEKIRAG